MALENHIKAVYPTKKGAGVLAKGRNGSSEKDVFDELCLNLYEFYERKQINGEQYSLVMPTVDFEKGANEYNLPVYFAETGPVSCRYFDKKTGKSLGLNLGLEELAELARNGRSLGRIVASEAPKKYGHILIKKLEPDTGREVKSIALGAFEWNNPLFLAYFNVYGKDRDSASKLSAAERDAFARNAKQSC